MARINYTIPPQGFERVRDRIGAILSDEFENQYFRYNMNAAIKAVWVERTIPFDLTELPCINVSLSTGQYGQKDYGGNVDGTYLYNIDFFAGAPTTPQTRGDQAAAFKVQQMLGVGRAILEDPQYDVLLFSRPFISNVHMTQLEVGEQKSVNDTLRTFMGRLTYSVRLNETVRLLTVSEIEGYETSWKLELTDKGYKYSNN